MKKIILILLVFVTVISCKQEEYMPEPYGEKVPYEEQHKESLDTLLLDSKSTLFKLALDRSTIQQRFAKEWKKLSLTFLVPSDAAFEKIGLTSEKIKNMDVADLDSLILYHTLSEKIDTSNVRSTYGNVRISTKLENRKIKTGLYQGDFYTYSHYFSITNNKVLINGKIVGDYKIKRTTAGDVILIDSFLKRPEKTLWQTMKEDRRLSMFMQIVETNDLSYDSYSWDPIYISQMQEAVMQLQLDVTYSGQDMILSTNTSVFAPTNEAFIKAGYRTAEEFMKLNEPNWVYRGEYLTFEGGAPYNFRTFHKTDSILTYHHGWAQRYYPTDGGGGGFSTVFFSNDLTDRYLGDYVLQMETLSLNNQPRVTCPYKFLHESGKIKIRLKNAKSTSESATIVEQDILTLNGPLHIVDRLFIPDNF